MKSFVSLKNWPRCQTAAELLSTEHMDVSNKQKHTCKKMEKQTVEPENPDYGLCLAAKLLLSSKAITLVWIC